MARRFGVRLDPGERGMRCGVGVLGPTVGHAGVTARAGRATGMIGVGAGGDPTMSAPTPALLRSASPSPERGIRSAVCPTGGAAWLRYVCVCVWFPNALRSLKQTPASLAVEIASRWGEEAEVALALTPGRRRRARARVFTDPGRACARAARAAERHRIYSGTLPQGSLLTAGLISV